jgi:hypothetical protein
MAKISAPLLSLGARGSIGGALTFAAWRGVAYVRQLVTPANPRSTAQVLTRDIFTNMGLRWKQGGVLMRAPWDRYAVGQKFVGRNAYMGQNLAAMRGEADMDLYIGSPGAKGGLPAVSLVLASAAALGIEATITAPTPPTGWTLTSGIATCFIDQAPEDDVADTIQEGEQVAIPGDVDFTGLTATTYQVQAWLKWEKPDASIAYGASISDTILVTA